MPSDAPSDVPEETPGTRSPAGTLLKRPIRRWWPLTRAQAFCLHLTLSLLVFSTLVFAMLMLWFPGKLFVLGGGWEGLKLVAMVDLVLGPALTLLLYRPGKPGVRLDMSLIAALQIAALGYGSFTTWQQRPVAVVFAEGEFNTLSAAAHATANAELLALQEQPRRVRDIDAGLVPVLVNPPPDQAGFGSYLADLFNGYPEPHERSDRFVNANDARDTLALAALPVDAFDIDVRALIASTLQRHGLTPGEVQLHRFKTRYGRGVTLFDPAQGRVIDWLTSPPSLAAARPAGD